MHIFKFNLKLSISKNIVYFACQFFTNFAKTNVNSGLVAVLNCFKSLPRIHWY